MKPNHRNGFSPKRLVCMAYTFLYNIIYGHPSLYEIISKGHEGWNAHWAFFFYIYIYIKCIYFIQTIIFILITPTEIVRNHNKQNALRWNARIFFYFYKVYHDI